jgi:hypothetical protein
MPQLVTCPCQHCNGHIQFDPVTLSEENNIITCPHCSLETVLFVPNPPPAAFKEVSAKPQLEPRKSWVRRRIEWLIALAGAALFAAVPALAILALPQSFFMVAGWWIALLIICNIVFTFFGLTLAYLAARAIVVKLKPGIAIRKGVPFWRLGATLVLALALVFLPLRHAATSQSLWTVGWIPSQLATLCAERAFRQPPPAKPAQPITGAFGYVLGATLPSNLEVDLKDGYGLYTDSTTNYPQFDAICVWVNSDRRIYQIWGQKFSGGYDDLMAVKQALITKYGPGTEGKTFLSRQCLAWGDSAQALSFEWSDDFKEFKVEYTDKQLESIRDKAAEEVRERSQKETASRLTNSL